MKISQYWQVIHFLLRFFPASNGTVEYLHGNTTDIAYNDGTTTRTLVTPLFINRDHYQAVAVCLALGELMGYVLRNERQLTVYCRL